MSAGTYNLSGGINVQNKSNVTLRGAGANQTLLVFSGSGTGCWGQGADVCARSDDISWEGGPSNASSFTGSGPWPRGTTQITLSSTANLSVGKTMILDQVDDLTDSGTVYVCEQSQSISPNQNPPCNDDAGGTGGDGGAPRNSGTPTARGQQQFVTVTAISGSTVTFTPGLYMPNWRVFSDSRGTNTPGAWWATSPVTGVGFEDMSVDHSNSSAFMGIQLFNCNGCWVKGVRDINSDRDHVGMYMSAHDTVRDSYFYGTKNSVSQSYGVEAYGSSDSLVENNIFQRVAAPQMNASDCEGCVWAYNFTINDYFAQSAGWLSQGIYLHAINSFTLIEGNVGSGMYADAFHGTHNFSTLFRNRFDGFETNNGTTTYGHTNPVILFPFSRYFNVIGNVLGTTGYHTAYQYTPSPETGAGDQAVLLLGTGTVSCCQAGDAKVASTLFLWGNYDTVNNAVRFQSSEVPSALSLYANSVPASQTLPASFFHASQPGWWPSSKPWPAIGPDVTGGNIANVGGHANTIPAQDCYSKVMNGVADGTGGLLSFNASNCYGTGGSGGNTPPTTNPPAPPSGLSATVS